MARVHEVALLQPGLIRRVGFTPSLAAGPPSAFFKRCFRYVRGMRMGRSSRCISPTGTHQCACQDTRPLTTTTTARYSNADPPTPLALVYLNAPLLPLLPSLSSIVRLWCLCSSALVFICYFFDLPSRSTPALPLPYQADPFPAPDN